MFYLEKSEHLLLLPQQQADLGHRCQHPDGNSKKAGSSPMTRGCRLAVLTRTPCSVDENKMHHRLHCHLGRSALLRTKADFYDE